MSIVPCFDPTSGASGGPAPTGGGGEDQALTFSDGTVIGSGFEAGSSSDTIRMNVASGQAAATASNGLSGMIGGIWWKPTSSPLNNLGPVCLNLEWATSPVPVNWHVVVVVAKLTSDPTALSDFQDKSKWMQVKTSGTSGVSTFVNQTTGNLATVNNENKSSSVSVQAQIPTGPKGTGGIITRHYFTSGTTPIVRTQATYQTQATGSIYIGLLFAKAATAAGDEVLQVKLRGGLPQ